MRSIARSKMLTATLLPSLPVDEITAEPLEMLEAPEPTEAPELPAVELPAVVLPAVELLDGNPVTVQMSCEYRTGSVVPLNTFPPLYVTTYGLQPPIGPV